MEKEYDYDLILKLTGPGGELDSSLSNIQSTLKTLREQVEECQNYFHGKGVESTIYDKYRILLENCIGTSATEGSYWWATANLKTLGDMMYTNAENDMKVETGQ